MLIEFLIFAFCLIGCGIHSWKLGINEGIEHAVQYFVDTGVIEVDDDE